MTRHVILGVLCAAALTVPVAAHHSHVNYAIADLTTLEGTVREIHLINPHSWIYLEVKNDKGEPEIWSLETTNPGGLERAGIHRDFVKPGDVVKVRCHRARDNSNGCLLGFLTPMHGDASRGHGVEKQWD